MFFIVTFCKSLFTYAHFYCIISLIVVYIFLFVPSVYGGGMEIAMKNRNWQHNLFEATKIKLNKITETENCITVKEAEQLQRKQFAERLKTFRKKAGMKQNQLSEKTGIDRTLISRYENGLAMPRDKTIELLANSLNVSINDLIGNETVDINKTKIEYYLKDFGILAEFSKDEKSDTVVLNSIELPDEIIMPLHKLEEILNETEIEAVKFFEPFIEKYYHDQLLHKLSNYKIITDMTHQ